MHQGKPAGEGGKFAEGLVRHGNVRLPHKHKIQVTALLDSLDSLVL